MLHRLVAALTLTSATITAADAAILITHDSTPTVDKPGYTTFKLTAISDGAPIIGFDFTGDPNAPVDPDTSLGFFGCFCQVNPAGNPTVFNDVNLFFPLIGADVSQDTQFRFSSSALNVVPNSARESETMLQAAFISPQPLGTSVAFVQLAVADGDAISFRGKVYLADGSEVSINGMSALEGSVRCVPEPSTLALTTVALLGVIAATRRK